MAVRIDAIMLSYTNGVTEYIAKTEHMVRTEQPDPV